MRVILHLSLVLLCSCGTQFRSKPGANVASEGSILDRVLCEQQFAEAVAAAQRDLSSDEWENEPYRFNRSRKVRESKVAAAMLVHIQPLLRRMSVTELIHSLKPDPLGTFSGVADLLYAEGNEMIIKEVKTRPRAELAVLRKLADPNLFVYRGPQGDMASLADILKGEILNGSPP
jgi:hypothetical protein